MRLNLLYRLISLPFLSGMALSAEALGVTFTVNTTKDEVDNDIGDGRCETQGILRRCTLRAAIQEANAHSGSHFIYLPADLPSDLPPYGYTTYTLTISGHSEDNSARGDLDIRRNITISGMPNRGQRPFISGGDLDRVFHVFGNATVSLINVLIINGNTFFGQAGGGLRVESGANVILSESPIFDNAANRGGGIYIRSGASLVLNNSDVFSNAALDFGGGILNDGAVLLNSSNVSENFIMQTEGRGAGIYNDGGAILTVPANGRASISGNGYPGTQPVLGGGIFNQVNGTVRFEGDVTLSGNNSQDGGGIYNLGTAELGAAKINSNFVKRSGGGLFNGGEASITSGVISDNSSSLTGTAGAGIVNEGSLTWNVGSCTGNDLGTETTVSPDGAGGCLENRFGAVATLIRINVSENRAHRSAGIHNNGTLTLVKSSVWDNTANFAGGIGTFGTMNIVNSLIHGNIATEGKGGGIYNGSDLTIQNSTIARNIGVLQGGGIFSEVSPVIMNSILALNVAAQGSDCFPGFTSGGFNLVQNSSGCTGGVNRLGDILNQAANVGTITGTDPPMVPLLRGSPAIDSASPLTPGSGANACAIVDQQGSIRPRDGNNDGISRCDMGAIEMGEADNPRDLVGSPSLSNPLINATAGEVTIVQLSWEVPPPRVWRELHTVDLQIVDPKGIALWVRFHQERNSVSVYHTAAGKFGPEAELGEPRHLQSNEVSLSVGESQVQGTGSTGARVTETLVLRFKPTAAGRTFRILSQASLDSGETQGFATIGAISVERP